MPSETAERVLRPRRRGRSAAKEQPSAIVLRHPGGERRKRVKLGFAWDLFLLRACSSACRCFCAGCRNGARRCSDFG